MNKTITGFCLLLTGFVLLGLLPSGCANIIPPGGGPKDSTAPVLLQSIPRDSTRYFKGNRISLQFNEYVTLENQQENLIVSPNPKNAPLVESKLRTITIQLKDTLEANTTYAINFGNAIKDVNEGNVARQFTYVFSTGSAIDSSTLAGNVQLAGNGKIDSTLLVVLHRNLADSAIYQLPPRYIARLDGKGRFRFTHLPAGKFNLFALPNDYAKRYDDSTKLFAFLDSSLVIAGDHPPVTLFAYQEFTEQPKAVKKTESKKKKDDKPLRAITSFSSGDQDILGYAEIAFSRPIATADTSKILLTDTNFVVQKGLRFQWDTSFTRLTLRYKWPEDTHFKLIIPKDAVADSSGINLLKGDTIHFKTKRESEYGSLRFRFGQLNLGSHPVLQIVQNDKVVDSISITQTQLSWKLYRPGDYELRILFDTDQNGTWSTGHFWEGKKVQPERVLPAALPSNPSGKITIRPNWDNEWDVDVRPAGSLAEDPAAPKATPPPQPRNRF